MNLREIFSKTSKRLSSVSAKSDLEAEILLTYACKISKTELYSNLERPVTKGQTTKLEKLIERRLLREPIAYITNTKEFYGNEFFVNNSVLIPRPETEFLVEIALKHIKKSQKKSLRVLEIGSGSGCISISIALESNKKLTIDAIDMSSKAIAVAKKNQTKLLTKNSSKINFMIKDVTDFTAQKPYDLIISNPPYIRSKTIEDLAPDVAKFEPLTALDGGPDGLKFYRIIIEKLSDFSSKGCFVCFEIDSDQKKALSILLKAHKLNNFDFLPDLSGKTRYLLINS